MRNSFSGKICFEFSVYCVFAVHGAVYCVHECMVAASVGLGILALLFQWRIHAFIRTLHNMAVMSVT
jgi:hypothetical protein